MINVLKVWQIKLWTLVTVSVLGFAPWVIADESLVYNTHYTIALDPEHQGALVSIKIDNRGLIERLVFKNNKELFSNIRANGKLQVNDLDVIWDLPKNDAQLTLFAKITHEKSQAKYDAMITKSWAIFRGDDLIPAMHTYEADGAYSKTTMEFQLPDAWKNVETGWPRLSANRFEIDNPDRRFDRPTGWIIAGNLGTRRATVKQTQISVSAPTGEHFRRMDVLTFLNFVWREMNQAFEVTPEKLLVVGSGDPMWRGGLSASNSLFLHADRPMVSENGTSPIIHELTHMVTRISGQKTEWANDDWIAEGIAEFYSFELLYRAKGMTKLRRNKIVEKLSAWGKDVKHLRQGPSTAAITARAVVLLDELDKEIRTLSKEKYCLDDVVRQLMKKRKVSLDDLKLASQALVKGKSLNVFNSPLLVI